jgi:hypothetical protein
MFRIFKKKMKKKIKENEKPEENSKTKKPYKKHIKKKKPSCRRTNGPAQHRAHAGGAGFGPTNGRSIGFAGLKRKSYLSLQRAGRFGPRSRSAPMPCVFRFLVFLLFFCCFFFTGSCILGFYQVFGFVVWFL